MFTTGVNFINLISAHFLYKRCFSSFFYVHVTRESCQNVMFVVRTENSYVECWWNWRKVVSNQFWMVSNLLLLWFNSSQLLRLSLMSLGQYRTAGVNFTNFLQAALMCADPKSAKRQYSCQYFFTLWDLHSQNVDEIDTWSSVLTLSKVVY